METIVNRKSRYSLETSRADSGFKRKYCRKGANLEFIATYMFTHFGAKSTDIRRALCRERGKDYNRGMYTCYFSEMPSWKAKYKNRFWIKKNNGWYLTTQGMGLVQLTGETQ